VSKIEKTEEQWKQELDSETYRVTRQAGTEAAFSGKYWDLKAAGMYKCVACGEALFSSETKYDSGSGWPSFYAPAKEGVVGENDDQSHGMIRTEVVCKKCDSHLGHVFPDGPPETGLRYCINSASLQFDESDDESAEES
jgi:peptide-methionine (R)-S-oxide reductase